MTAAHSLGGDRQLPLFAALPPLARPRPVPRPVPLRGGNAARAGAAALAGVDAVPAWRPVPLALIAGLGPDDDGAGAGPYADADLRAERERNRRLAAMINRRWAAIGVDAGARAVPVAERGAVIGWAVETGGLCNGVPVVAT
ncbi:MAG: hypothetical protein J0H82_04455 [Alphaproteobacteria bacterium]|jgi:hypothetical protein|nr:hypothetical protein [Alphaproteobacteria bacterium]